MTAQAAVKQADTGNDKVIEVDGAAGKRLKSFIERIERLEEERQGLSSDIKDVYAEAKSVGFDVPTMRRIVKLRKMDEDKRAEAEALTETYAAAIGMQYTLAV